MSRRRQKRVHCLAGVAFILFLNLFYLQAQSNTYATITVNNKIHEAYGLAYPVTYQFSCDSISGSSAVLMKNEIGATWVPIATKTSNDFFNGEKAVRFDTGNNMIYVSVPFSQDSDQILLQFIGVGEIKYRGIAKYYDNRKAAITVTADDWDENGNIIFTEVCEKFIENKIWLTVGVITSGLNASQTPTKDVIQTELGKGYIEVASHSQTHDIPSNVRIEVESSKQEILNNLILPPLFKKAEKEYLYSWIMPGTVHETADLNSIDSELGLNNFIVDRRSPLIEGFELPPPEYVNWNNEYHLYTNLYLSTDHASLDYETISDWEASFDSVYSNGGIFLAVFHPKRMGNESNLTLDDINNFLIYIKSKNSIWSASLGHLYLYHFLQENDGTYITVTCSSSQDGNGFKPPEDWLNSTYMTGNNWYIGDFNGDQFSDILRYIPDVSGSQVFVSDGNRFNNNGCWTSADSGSDGWYIGDFNGGGRSDIMRYVLGVSGGQVFLSDGTKFNDNGSWTGAGYGSDGWYIGDFNGDGRSDIMRYVLNVSGGQVFLSDGEKFDFNGSWTGAGYGSDGWYIGDFNGDGLSDIMSYIPGVTGGQVFLSDGTKFNINGSWTAAGNYGHWYIGDFNGDHKTDLIRYCPESLGQPAGLELFKSTGSGFQYDGFLVHAEKGSSDWYVADFNGDGKSDVMRYIVDNQGDPIVQVFISNK